MSLLPDIDRNLAVAAVALTRTFAQPAGQALPQDFLALLVALDRAQHRPASR